MKHLSLRQSLTGKRQVITLILLLLGIRFWLALPFDQMMTRSGWAGLAIGLCFSLIPVLNKAGRVGVVKTARFFGRHRVMSALAVGLLVGIYLLKQVWHGYSEMFLRIHDEHSYMIQARMLARGRLWEKAYPPDIAPFFDTFHVIVDRVYASIYFPGAAMSMVPAVWLGLPYWVSPLVCGVASAVFFFLIAWELFGCMKALIAVLMLVSLQYFRWMCFMLMSETSFLLAAMVLIWAWLRWRRHQQFRWAMLMGAAAGWGAITRPLDAICFSTAVGIAILFESRSTPRVILKTAGAIALAAAPFVAIQIVQNVGVTGKWDESPMQYYIARNYPAPIMGFSNADLKNLPPGLSLPKQMFAASWMPLYEEHTVKNVLKTWYKARFQQLRRDTLPDTDLFLLFPLALAARWDIRRAVMLGSIVLMLVAYLGYIFHFDQYLVPVMPGMICTVLMGWEGLERAWPRYRRHIGGFVAPTLIGLTLSSTPEFGHAEWAIPNLCETAKAINQDLSALKTPSVVLFPFTKESNAVDWFPVFNDSVAWPDDALVIRANSLGKNENCKLYDYYARIQPGRSFFVYGSNQSDDLHNLRYIGTAKELAARHANR